MPENGETWKVDLAHQIKGAHTLIDEGHKARTTISTVTGRVKVGAAAWQNFDFNPSVTDSGLQSGSSNQPFTGSAAASVQGTTAETITVEYGFDVYALSDSNLAFPAEAGTRRRSASAPMTA